MYKACVLCLPNIISHTQGKKGVYIRLYQHWIPLAKPISPKRIFKLFLPNDFYSISELWNYLNWILWPFLDRIFLENIHWMIFHQTSVVSINIFLYSGSLIGFSYTDYIFCSDQWGPLKSTLTIERKYHIIQYINLQNLVLSFLYFLVFFVYIINYL